MAKWFSEPEHFAPLSDGFKFDEPVEAGGLEAGVVVENHGPGRGFGAGPKPHGCGRIEEQ
jgi:hypothetical protein